MSNLLTPVRALALLALVAVPRFAAARSEPTATSTTASPPADGIPLDGVLIIAGIVAVIVLLAWVCSRVSDAS